MEMIIDVVPNHMGISAKGNTWRADVLEPLLARED